MEVHFVKWNELNFKLQVSFYHMKNVYLKTYAYMHKYINKYAYIIKAEGDYLVEVQN